MNQDHNKGRTLSPKPPPPSGKTLQVPPLSAHGNISEIITHFGTAENLRAAVSELHVTKFQELPHAA